MRQLYFEDEIKKIPFLRYLVPFMLGIYIHHNYPISRVSPFLFYILASILFIVLLVKRNKQVSLSTNWSTGLIIHGLLFLAGFVLMHIESQLPRYVYENNGTQTYVGYVPEKPDTSAGHNKYLVTLESCKTDSGWYKTTGKTCLYIPDSPSSGELKPGSKIIFRTTLIPYANAGNPDEFDYRKYMFSRKIYTYAFIATTNWRNLNETKKSFKLYSIRVREYLLSMYRKYGIKGDEYAVLAALTLGDKTELDKNMKQIYAQSGAMHILAVSGLHIGILYLVLNFLLGFMKKGRFTRLLIIITAIWAYAFITGLSPSVQRAAIMFSFISLGKAGRRVVNNYNMLALSAFMILSANPEMLFHVGFQFSYFAVAGILLIQPGIANLYNPKVKFINYTWQLLTVSIAAQLSTFPLTLYYFNYFPSYFWLTNLFIIPLVTIIFCLAILLLLLSFSNVLAIGLAWALSSITHLINYITGFVSNLPGSTINDLSINRLEVVFIYSTLIFMVLYFTVQNRRWFLFALSGIALLLFTDNLTDYKILNSQNFIVYNVRNVSLYQFINGNENIIFTTPKKETDVNSILYSLKNPLIKKRQKKSIHYIEDDQNRTVATSHNIQVRNVVGNTFLHSENRTFVFLQNDSLLNSNLKEKLYTDKIVISKAVTKPIEDIIKVFDTQAIIIDSSVSPYKAQNYIEACNAMGINCFYTRGSAYSSEI